MINVQAKFELVAHNINTKAHFDGMCGKNSSKQI